MDDDDVQRRSGSAKIREAFGDRDLISERQAGFITPEQVAWLADYGNLMNFWVRGQPRPDRFGGLIDIEAGREGDFVQQAVENWDLPFKLQFLSKGSCVTFSYPDGQPSVEAIPDKR